MNIDPGLSIVLSFMGFLWIFAKKIYPLITKKLDEHIDSIANKIQEAELLKDKAYASLKMAYIKKDDVEEKIKENRKKSEEKIRHLRQENEKLLKLLRERQELSLKTQLEAELSKQRDMLIARLSDQIIKKLLDKVADADCKTVTSVTKEDIKKLL